VGSTNVARMERSAIRVLRDRAASQFFLDPNGQIGALVKFKLKKCARPENRAGFFVFDGLWAALLCVAAGSVRQAPASRGQHQTNRIVNDLHCSALFRRRSARMAAGAPR